MKDVDCRDFYSDGRHYDLKSEGITDDIPMYLDLAARYGAPVLEIACGTGRVTIPLARRGLSVTGLDLSRPMLQVAESKARAADVAVTWVCADCRDFELGRKFRLVIFPFNSMAHIHDIESIEAFLSCVRAHLDAGGRFVIDIFNPKLEILLRDASEEYPVAEYPDPDGKGTVVVTENNIYDRATQMNHIKWYHRTGEDAHRVVQELNMRIFYPQELDALLHFNGFVIEHKYGDCDLQPFTSASPRQIVVCRTA
jgi:SAM-dependent methyltransferase